MPFKSEKKRREYRTPYMREYMREYRKRKKLVDKERLKELEKKFPEAYKLLLGT